MAFAICTYVQEKLLNLFLALRICHAQIVNTIVLSFCLHWHIKNLSIKFSYTAYSACFEKVLTQLGNRKSVTAVFIKSVTKFRYEKATKTVLLHAAMAAHCHITILFYVENDRCNVADIVFALDSSGSIGIENWQKVLNFTKSIAGGFDIGPENVQIGVNYYSNAVSLAFHLNE